MGRFKRILSLFIISALLATTISPSVLAKDTTEKISGRVYEFSKKNDYEIDEDNFIDTTSSTDVMGNFSIEGNLSTEYSTNDIKRFTVEEGKNIELKYNYTDDFAEAGKLSWHIVDDGDEEVNGFDLDDDIDSGALVLLTSLDHDNWHLKDKYLDICDSIKDGSATKSFETNEVELSNGCYYKVIVAYKMEKKKSDSMWSGSDVKKVAEVYEFYAAYKSAQNKTISANSYTFSDRVHAGDDDGYNKHNPITSGDPHYGWNIGSFVISGFTRKTEENGIPVFIKNAGHDDKPGDNIELWFKLEQKDLKKLNGDSDLYLAEDTNGYDEYFEYEKTNLKHGALFIRQTDNTNTKSKVIAYTDFLAALCSPAANTKIGLFEEGDYEVALDYQVNKKGIFDDENDYCMFFRFKIRNGSAMGYLFDLDTGNEIGNKSIARNGFKIDLANSKYLNIYVQRMKYIKGDNGYYTDSKDTDTKYSRPASDGETFKDEGIYTIEFTNPTTGKSEKKQVYVGNDPVIKASLNEANGNLTINEIVTKVKDYGAEINADGILIYPKKEDSSISSAVEAAVSVTSKVPDSETSSHNEANDSAEEKSSFPIIPVAAGGGAVVLVGLIVVAKKAGGKKHEKQDK